MNEGELPAIIRLVLAGCIVLGVLVVGVSFVVWGYYVLPLMAVLGVVVILYRWLQGGAR